MLSDDEIADLAGKPVETVEDTRGTPVLNDADGDSYKVATLSYMVKGGDGFGDILKEDPVTGRRRPIVKEEAGYRLDAIMEKFIKSLCCFLSSTKSYTIQHLLLHRPVTGHCIYIIRDI